MQLYRLLLKLKAKMPLIKRLSNGMFSVVFLAVLVVSGVAIYQSTRSTINVQEPYSIFILAGQSNAEGSNSYKFNLEPGTGFDKANHPADTATGFWWAGADGQGPEGVEEFIQYFSGQNVAGWEYSGTGANDRMQNLTDTQLKNQFGSEMGSSRTLYDMGRRKVVFLKVTYGFQALANVSSQHIPFNWNINGGEGKSYDHLKDEFKALTDYIRAEGGTYTVDGLFWIQGETDTLQGSFASAYEQNLRDLVSAAKTDFELHPDARIVLSKISLHDCVDSSYPLTGSYCGAPYALSIVPVALNDLFYSHPFHARQHKQVRDALQEVSDDDPQVEIVETMDLQRGMDWIHMTEASQLELGRRFVNMYDLPRRFETGSRKNDYDQDGKPNKSEDTGRGAGCQLSYNAAGNGNLGDDDADCDGYPNYLDKFDTDGVSNGL